MQDYASELLRVVARAAPALTALGDERSLRRPAPGKWSPREIVLTKPFARHNLHELAWQPLAAGEPATLDFFMRDYVAHLEHHLRQALGNSWDDGVGN